MCRLPKRPMALAERAGPDRCGSLLHSPLTSSLALVFAGVVVRERPGRPLAARPLTASRAAQELPGSEPTLLASAAWLEDGVASGREQAAPLREARSLRDPTWRNCTV